MLPVIPRHERIKRMVEHTDPNVQWGDRLTKSLKRFRENPKRKDFKEQFGDNLTAYLFIKNRERYNPQTYDLEKEKRQIKAVTAFLEGKHIHMGTREGKTSTVFPIASMVDALTSDIGSSVLIGTDEVLLGKLKKHAEFFSRTLAEASPELQLVLVDKEMEHGAGGIDKKSKQQMVREGLLKGGYTEESRKAVSQTYWSDAVAADRHEESQFMPKSVYFSTDRTQVFDYMADPAKFRAQTGNMFFDEADVPYSRRSPYASVNEDQYYSPDEITDSTADWMRRFIVSKQLRPGDLVVDAGGHTLTGGASKRLGNLKISEHLRGYDYERPKSDDDVVRAFNEGVEVIAKKLDLSVADKKMLANRLANTHLNIEPENSGGYYEKTGADLASLHRKKGLLYTMENGSPRVRDSYIDQMLQDHKFSSQEQMNILVLEGEFEFVPLNPVSFKRTTFQSFAKANGDRLHCASGTLMFPDPETHKVKQSSFASFLKDATGKNIEVVSAPAIKTVPNPKITETENDSISQVVNSIPDKPTLVVSYHLDKSSEIYRQLVEKYGADKVAYVRSKPSDPKELETYEKETEMIYSELAEGNLRVVVSSGAAGFGVDIIKKDGGFPDLHVALHGLPTNRAQMMQIYGRRGAKGDDFTWYVSREFLEPYIMLFEDRSGRLANALGKWDRDEVSRRIDEAIKDPERGRSLMLEIIKTSEVSENTDDEVAIILDEYMEFVGRQINESINTKLKGIPGMIDEMKTAFSKKDGNMTRQQELTKTYGEETIKAVIRENGLYSIIAMNDNEFKALNESIWTNKEMESIKRDVGKQGSLSVEFFKKSLPGLEDFTDKLTKDLRGISNAKSQEEILSRIATIRSEIQSAGWDGVGEPARTFLSQQIGLPDGMKEFLLRDVDLIEKKVQGKDARTMILNLNSHLRDEGILTTYATSWYQYRKQVVEEYMGAVREGGEMYFHQPLDVSVFKKHIFSRIDNDPQVKGLEWGRTRIWDEKERHYQDFLSYKKDNKIYFLHTDEGEYLSYSSGDQFKDVINGLVSGNAYNLYGAGYSFLTE